ncbi:MAG TPA: NAD(P)/FAD-dependent oxidoreductase, partial [Candidatus Binataceae bacterium]|nr:NAD(P)/FAD-dependent oxidoreductase [Candidatus Binataceae bacterium]
TDKGDTVTARVVICAVGGLVDPAYPDIKGLKTFAGRMFHTARWDHSYDLTGKRVGVIGTGASAIQVVPSIAPQVKQLTVFQRTAAWVVPRSDHPYSERAKQMYARHPWRLNLSRLAIYWTTELFGPMIFLDAPKLSSLGEKMAIAHLHKQVKNPELRKKLTPNYQFGCKRVLVSDDYYATFARENVELATEHIEEICPAGIKTADGKLHELDAIVLATGFDLGLTHSPFPVTGRSGKSLDETWKNGAVAYKGMTVSGFPNWFILMGPNTGPGHTSVLVYTEAQIEHALGAIRKLMSNGVKFVDIRQDVQDRYNVGIQGRMKYMVWNSGCNSWYLSEDGSNHSLYPGFAAEYALRARHFKESDYEISHFA